jgi:hypothetical protein
MTFYSEDRKKVGKITHWMPLPIRPNNGNTNVYL